MTIAPHQATVGLPTDIATLLTPRIPRGERDERAWKLAYMCERRHLPMHLREELAEQLFARMDQAPDDYMGVDTVLEKVYRAASQPHHPRYEPEPRDLAIPIIETSTEGLPHVGQLELGEAALAYLHAGLSVVPLCWPDDGGHCAARGKGHSALCRSPGKAALVRWGEFQKRLPTEGEVQGWWERWPQANIGIITGKVSGLVVLDFDKWDQLREHKDYASWCWNTPVVRTARGGHVYLRTERTVASTRFDKVDLQGEGRLVVAPPSVHHTGVEYRRIDQAESNILSVKAGLPQYLVSAVMAEEGLSVYTRVPLTSDLPVGPLREVAQTAPKVYDELQVCCKIFRPLTDEQQHTALHSWGCHISYCPHHAMAAARDFVALHQERLSKMENARTICWDIGQPYKLASETFKALRQKMRKAGVQGDLMLTPNGEADADKHPLYAIVGVCDRDLPIVQEGQNSVPLYRLAFAVSTALVGFLWHAYSGAALWHDPTAWGEWRREVKGKRLARGIEDGTRTPRLGKRKRTPILCPLCGSEMVLDKTRGPVSREEALELEQTGEYRRYGPLLMRVQEVEGYPKSAA